MKKRKIEHTTFRNGALFCTHCGQSHRYKSLMLVTDFVKMTDDFNKLHGDCLPVWKQPEPNLSTSYKERLLWWTLHGEQGTSSSTIFCVLVVGKTPGVKFDYEYLKHIIMPPARYRAPSDPDDFRRCYMLLKAVPEFRARLDEMKGISKTWSNMIDNWDKLTAMLEEGLTTKKENGMFEFMQTLQG